MLQLADCLSRRSLSTSTEARGGRACLSLLGSQHPKAVSCMATAVPWARMPDRQAGPAWLWCSDTGPLAGLCPFW